MSHYSLYDKPAERSDPIGGMVLAISIMTLFGSLLVPIHMFWLPLVVGGLTAVAGVGGIYMSKTKASRVCSWTGYVIAILTILIGLYAYYEYHVAMTELQDVFNRIGR